MSDTKFRPVQGADEKIKQSPYTEGYVYFATDTGRIYLDTEGERVPLGGGGVSILYAQAAQVKENVDGTYAIQIEDLDDSDAKPSMDDLIINSDGRFFKVIDSDDLEMICSLIAVSGTGGGGGPVNPDSPGGTTATIKLEQIVGVRGPYIFGQSAYVTFKATATEDYDVTYTISIQSNDGSKKSIQRSAESGAEFTFDIGKELYAGLNLVTVTASGANSGSTAPRRYTNVNCIEMLLKESPDFNPLLSVSGALEFKCMPVGEISKTLKIYIDGELQPDLTLENFTTSDEERSITIPPQSHGMHKIKAVLSTGAGGATATAEPLEYEVAWIERDNLTPIIWFKEVPKQIVNHENFVLQYKVLNPANREKSQANLYINQMEIPTSPVTVSYDTSNLQWEKWSVTGYRLGENTLTVACGTESRSITLLVVKDDRNMEISTSGLFLNLTTDGRSNKENKTSREQWSYTNASNETTSVSFQGFNWYNNGWILDEEDKACLRISNGASIKIPLSVLNAQDLVNSLTFEFQFKLRNVQEYATLIKTSSYEDENGKVVIEKEINVEKGVFANYFKNNIGFCLGTQEAFFKSSGNAVVDARYREDEMINLSFVIESKSISQVTPLMYIYLNGILSGIATYGANDKFGAEINELVFNSNYCDIDLYKIRVYKTNLPSHTVVNNYIADLNDAKLYDMNQIVKFSNGVPRIDYGLLMQYNASNPEELSIPYAILEYYDIVDDPEERLPFKKGMKKDLNVTFVNPALDRAYANGEITDEQYLTGCPSFTATRAQFDVQGTSSQGYPRRNFKGKFKNKGDDDQLKDGCTWVYTDGPLKGKSLLEKNEFNGKEYSGFYMDNKDAAETTFTWKADYMESSMSHNTGFASFVKTLYSKHPLVDYLGTNYVTGDHRTTIYGFPMMVFQKKKDESYEFVGRYNFNLDKACNKVIDFENKTEHPFMPAGEDGKKPTFKDVAECWEFKNNQGGRCSFNLVDFEALDEKGNLALHSDFEYRYSPFKDEIDDAIDRKTPFTDPAYANEFLLEKFGNLKKLCDWLYSTNTTKVKEVPDELPAPVTYGQGAAQKTYTHDTVEYRLAKFQYEFADHFNLEYCLIYFIMTELLIQYDSRGKNMMLGSWGPQKLGGEYIWYPLFYDIDTQLGVNNSGVPSWEYYTEATETNQFSTSDSVLWNNFFACFYNDIVAKYNELRKGNLNITNLDGYYNYVPEVSKSYAMKGCKPFNVINVDEYYKYIAPAFSGYLDTEGKTQYTTLYFYCLQGNRAMHRSLFLKNRFNFQDSKWLAGIYDQTGKQQEFKIRFNANFWDDQDPQGKYTSDKYVEVAPVGEQYQQAIADGRLIVQPYGESPLDTDLSFEITPYLNQYVSVWYDDALARNPIKFDGKESVVVPPLDSIMDSVKNTLNFSQQLLYISGSEYLSSLGDLSLKYPDEFQITKAKRLKDLYIGNDNENYINNVMKDDAFYLNAGANIAGEGGTIIPNENAKTLLETVVLSNISSLSSPQDLSGSTKLKELRALGTQIGGVELAEGVPVEQLFLPKTITYFNLTEPTNLHGLLEQKPVKNADGKFPSGLYIEGITDKTSYSSNDKIKLNSITLKGGSLGYDSYKLLDKVVNIKKRMQQSENLDSGYNKRLSLFLEDVNWTPYRLVGKGELPDSELKYVKKTEHYTFDHSYIPDANWDSDVLNGRIYEYDEANFLANQNVLTNLDMVDTFIDSYLNKDKFFMSTIENEEGSSTLPYLTGNIYVNNSANDLISEAELKNKYKDLYYPDLNIFVAHAAESYVAKFVEVLDSGVEKEWETLKYDPAGDVSSPDQSQIAEITPAKLHYDFIGWATKPNATEKEIITDFSQYKFSQDNKVYIFYAIYKKHEYTISFYNYDGVTLLAEKKVPYNEYLSEPNLMPYRDDSMLDLDKRYGFKGYTIDKLQTNITNENEIKDIVKDVSTMVSDRNWDLYACFMEESVYSSVLDNSYYVFDETAYVDIADSKYNVAEGQGVRLRLIKEVSGKITLPTVDTTGKPVISVTGRKNSNSSMTKDLTHVFWDRKNASELRRVDGTAFADSEKLKYFEYGDKLREIGDYSFGRCLKLEMFDWSKNIVVIRPQAFNQAYRELSTPAISQLTIGGKVQRIEGEASLATTGAFSYNDKDFTIVQFGTPEQPCEMQYLGDRAFTFNMNFDTQVPYTIKQLIVYYADDAVKQRFEEWTSDGRLPCDKKEFNMV